MNHELRKLHDRLTFLHQMAGDALAQLVLVMEREPAPTPHPDTTPRGILAAKQAVAADAATAQPTAQLQPILPGTGRLDGGIL